MLIKATPDRHARGKVGLGFRHWEVECKANLNSVNTMAFSNTCFFFSFPGNSRAAAKAKKQVWCVHRFDTLTPRCTRKAGTSPLSLTQELVLSWVIFSPISLCGHISTMILMKLDFAYRWYLVVQVCKKPPGWQFNAAFVSYGNDGRYKPLTREYLSL